MQLLVQPRALALGDISLETSMCGAMGMEMNQGLSYAVQDAEYSPLQFHMINKVNYLNNPAMAVVPVHRSYNMYILIQAIYVSCNNIETT